MSGPADSYQDRGMVPRAITRLFEELQSNPDLIRTVRMTYLEIYNERIFDLLNPGGDPSGVAVVDGPKGTVVAKGVASPVVLTEQDALQLFFEGDANRAYAEHQLNAASSRSHAVITLHLETKRSALDSHAVVSKLHLVDLAGSERLRKTGSEGTVAREATFINKSLSFLEQVVVALGEKNRDHVPYRSSKLTYLLKDSLGGNSRTLMVANVWGEAQHLDETLSTCRFAQRMMRVACDYTQNVQENMTDLARNLDGMVKQLKEELAMYDAMSSRGSVQYDPYTPTQRRELRQQVSDFFAQREAAPESIEPLEILSVRHVTEILLQCRELYWSAQLRALPLDAGPPPRAAAPRAKAGVGAGGAGAGGADGAGGGQDGGRKSGPEGDAPKPEGVGEGGDPGDDSMVAPEDAAPPGAVDGAGAAGDGAAAPRRAGPRPARTDALDEYKRVAGAEGALLVQENKQALKEAKAKAREAGQAVNESKRKIDEIRARLEPFEAEREAKGAAGEPHPPRTATPLPTRPRQPATPLTPPPAPPTRRGRGGAGGGRGGGVRADGGDEAAQGGLQGALRVAQGGQVGGRLRLEARGPGHQGVCARL